MLTERLNMMLTDNGMSLQYTLASNNAIGMAVQGSTLMAFARNGTVQHWDLHTIEPQADQLGYDPEIEQDEDRCGGWCIRWCIAW